MTLSFFGTRATDTVSPLRAGLKARIAACLLAFLCAAGALSSEDRKFSVATTWHSFMNFGEEATNIQMYEFHFGYQITDKDKVEIKIATWKLFEPLGIQLWDSDHLMKESSYYPGRLLEYGAGLCYQRRFWEGLFGAVEIMPMAQTYLDTDGDAIKNGFRLYTSYHVGYRFEFLRGRFYVAPQVHLNYWPVMTAVPESFRQVENSPWSKNYVLFEPNVYLGIKF